jgi:hypothetical protein
MVPKLPTEQQAVWDPEPVRRSEDEKIVLPLPEFETCIIQALPIS